jgi:hypothetical protein
MLAFSFIDVPLETFSAPLRRIRRRASRKRENDEQELDRHCGDRTRRNRASRRGTHYTHRQAQRPRLCPEQLLRRHRIPPAVSEQPRGADRTSRLSRPIDEEQRPNILFELQSHVRARPRRTPELRSPRAASSVRAARREPLKHLQSAALRRLPVMELHGHWRRRVLRRPPRESGRLGRCECGALWHWLRPWQWRH